MVYSYCWRGISIYTLPVVIFLDAPLSAALGIGLGMAIYKSVNTFGLLSLGFLMMLGIGFITPALIFLLPVVWIVFIVKNFLLVAKKSIMQQKDIEEHNQ